MDFPYSYPDAAEEDVKRYERSYKRLPPAHKVFYRPFVGSSFMLEVKRLGMELSFSHLV